MQQPAGRRCLTTESRRQRDAEVTIRSSINKLAQRNQAQPFAYDRDKLVEMLDQALAPSAPATPKR